MTKNNNFSLEQAENDSLLLEFEIDKITIEKKDGDDEITLTLVSGVVIVCKGRALALLSTRGGISQQNERYIMQTYRSLTV